MQGMQGNNVKWILISFLSVLLITSCVKKLNSEEYTSFVSNPDNGLRKDQVFGDFELSALYEPYQYVVANDRDFATKEEYERYEHFQFRIKLNKGGNILLYKETQIQNEVTRINHFGFSAQTDFKIFTDNDTVPCKLVHYSRNYNLSPTIDLSLVFDAIPKDTDWQLVYEDQQFGLGRMKFLFKQENLENLPELIQ